MTADSYTLSGERDGGGGWRRVEEGGGEWRRTEEGGGRKRRRRAEEGGEDK
jgi:hypothetical protein